MTTTHQSQLAPGNSAITRSSSCTWTSLANGISNTTGGKNHPTPDNVHAHVKHSEETNPATPGWSLPDAILAAKRMGYVVANGSGERWAAVLEAVTAHHYVLVQGDSDQFGNATCSGKFDGDHCIGVKGQRAGGAELLIDDPICPTERWERAAVVRRYAEKLDPGVRFAVFALTIPQPKHVTLRYGAKALPKPTVKTIHVGPQHANVRARPTTEARVLNTRKSGGKWTAWQVTNKGEKVGGSSVWFGNRTGQRWLHESAF